MTIVGCDLYARNKTVAMVIRKVVSSLRGPSARSRLDFTRRVSLLFSSYALTFARFCNWLA
jgi:hypothetical protein